MLFSLSLQVRIFLAKIRLITWLKLCTFETYIWPILLRVWKKVRYMRVKIKILSCLNLTSASRWYFRFKKCCWAKIILTLKGEHWFEIFLESNITFFSTFFDCKFVSKLVFVHSDARSSTCFICLIILNNEVFFGALILETCISDRPSLQIPKRFSLLFKIKILDRWIDCTLKLICLPEFDLTIKHSIMSGKKEHYGRKKWLNFFFQVVKFESYKSVTRELTLLPI